jgi:hypothetical protein
MYMGLLSGPKEELEGNEKEKHAYDGAEVSVSCILLSYEQSPPKVR